MDNVTKRILKNGLTVLIKENHTAPVVAIVTYVKAGYFNEPDRLTGISHLIEHMYFKGTPRRGVGVIAQETKALGGYLNAATIYDRTYYYTVLPSRHWVRGLDVQSDALANSLFDTEELRRETEVVIQEAKRKLDTPAAFAAEKLFELAFKVHRIRRWRIGMEEGLRAITRDDVVCFYTQLYRPQNIILAVVGDVNPEEALEAIEQYYGHLDGGTLEKEESPPEPKQEEFRYARLSGDITETYLEIGFHTPGILEKDTHALNLLAFILGGGQSSRLYQSVKEEKRFVHAIEASEFALKELGVFGISATLEAKNLRDAEVAIFDEIARLQREFVTDEEMLKARNSIEAAWVFDRETVGGEASTLASYEDLGDYRLAEEYIAKLYAVTPEEIRRVAQEYLTLTRCSLLEYVPKSYAEPTPTAGELHRSLEEKVCLAPEHGPDASTAQRPNPSMTPAPPEIVLDRSPTVISCTRRPDTPIQRFRLSNGITLLVKENHAVPTVSVGAYFKGGRLREHPENAGITELTLRTQLKGTPRRSSRRIAAEIETLGSAILRVNEADYCGFSMSFVARHFTSAVNVLTDVLLDPTFPEEEIAKEKAFLLASIARRRDNMFSYPMELLLDKAFPSHAYGLPQEGREDTVVKLGKEDLVRWHERLLYPENLLVGIIGDVDTQEAIQWFETHLGKLSQKGERVTVTGAGNYPLEMDDGGANVVQREKAQTALAVGFRTPGYHHDDFYPLILIQNITSGLGGRFFNELREKQALAYTVSAFEVAHGSAGLYVAYIATSPDKEDRAREALLAEFQKLREEPVTEDELRRSKNYTIGTYEIALETNAAQLSEYARNELLGKGVEEVSRFPERIEAVTLEELQEVAQKYFDSRQYALGIVRGKVMECRA